MLPRVTPRGAYPNRRLRFPRIRNGVSVACTLETTTIYDDFLESDPRSGFRPDPPYHCSYRAVLDANGTKRVPTPRTRVQGSCPGNGARVR